MGPGDGVQPTSPCAGCSLRCSHVMHLFLIATGLLALTAPATQAAAVLHRHLLGSGCSDACLGGSTCQGGQCMCPKGGLLGTKNNCGKCGQRCLNPGETCQDGICCTHCAGHAPPPPPSPSPPSPSPPPPSPPPAWTTHPLAGSLNGEVGYALGNGADARFSFPIGIALKNETALYVADQGNHVIRIVTTSGDATEVLAGTPGSCQRPCPSVDGTGTQARLAYPQALAVGPVTGTLYFSDGCAIKKATPEGVVTTIAGQANGCNFYTDGPGASASFRELVWSICVDSTESNLYVTDPRSSTVRKVDLTSGDYTVSTIAGSLNNYGFSDGPGPSAQFGTPYACVVLPGNGALLVADGDNYAIRKVDLTTTTYEVTTPYGPTPSTGAQYGTVDGAGNDARFIAPLALTADAVGNVHVVDQSGIRLIDPSGYVRTIIGDPRTLCFGPAEVDGTGNAARLCVVWGVTVTPAGSTLYFTEYAGQRVRSATSS